MTNKLNKKQMAKEANEASLMTTEGVLRLAKIHFLMHGEIGKTYQEELHIEGGKVVCEDQATKLRQIGASDALQKPAFKKSLPASVSTLSRLAPLSVEFVEQAIKAKHIHPTMKESEAITLNRMNRELKGKFKANYQPPPPKTLTAPPKDMTWRDEMMTGFLRKADTYSDNELVIAFLNDVIGTDANDHKSLEDAFKEVVRQVEWLSGQMVAKRAMSKMLKAKAAEAVE